MDFFQEGEMFHLSPQMTPALFDSICFFVCFVIGFVFLMITFLIIAVDIVIYGFYAPTQRFHLCHYT